MSDKKSLNKNIREFVFTVDNSIIEELGERLMAKPSIALAELVKNSYDADATEVKVTFYKVSTKGGQISIEDNGEGMDEETLVNSWMRIGTTIKKRKPYSRKYKRARAGSKGVGRFACQSLANRLVVETVSGTRKKRTKATMVINWRKFTKGKDIDSVPVRCQIDSVDSSTPTGTKLKLISLKKKFNKSEIQKVLTDIVSLVTPADWIKESLGKKDDSKDPGFKVNLEVSEFPELRGDVGTKFLGSAWGVLRGIITDAKHAKYTFITPDEVFVWEWDKEFKHLAGAKYIAHYVLYDQLSDLPLGMSTRDAMQYGREHGGIRVYMDDFRIYPYGGPGNDWLKLDFDRSRSASEAPSELKEFVKTERPLLSLPRNSNLFGAVFLSRFLSHIEISTARDKLIENKAYDELSDFVRRGIDWITIIHAGERVRKEIESPFKKTKKKKDSVELFKQVTLEIEKDERLDTSQKSELKTRFRTVSKVIKEERKNLNDKVRILRVLASLGTSIAIFDHELGALLDSLNEVRYDLKDYTQYIAKKKQKEFNETLDVFNSWTDNVIELGSLIGLMAGSEARRTKRPIAVHDAVNNLVKPFNAYLNLKGIRFANQVPKEVHTPEMLEAEFNSIIINLLTNSIKAVVSGGKRSEISIIAKSTKRKITIDFFDSGVGLDQKHWDEVFEAFKSLHGPDSRFGLGTGLGLTIVRDIVGEYNGTVTFVEPPESWSTCIRMSFPY